MAIQIEAVNLTTQPIQNVSGTSSNIGFFFTGTWAQHPESGLLNVRPGWTVVGNPTWVVTMVDEGSQTITISGGIFISGQAYQFTGSGGLTMFGMTFSQSGAPSPTGDNVVGYAQMSPPVIPGQQLEDGTATINGSVGFTINNASFTGVTIPALTANNYTWFSTNYTTLPGSYTCTWGSGSTVASSTITVVNLNPTTIVFYIQGQTGAATYNYPFTFGV